MTERVEMDRIAGALLSAEPWALAGLTAADPRLREDAARELAAGIAELLEPQPAEDPRQLALFS